MTNEILDYKEYRVKVTQNTHPKKSSKKSHQNVELPRGRYPRIRVPVPSTLHGDEYPKSGIKKKISNENLLILYGSTQY